MSVAPSARASRNAASSARVEIASPLNGSRMRRESRLARERPAAAAVRRQPPADGDADRPAPRRRERSARSPCAARLLGCVAQRPVGHDAHVDPLERAHEPDRERVAEALEAARRHAGARRGRTSSPRSRANSRTTRMTSSDSTRWNSAPRSAHSRRSARSPRSSSSPRSREGCTHSTSSGAPRRSAERQARRTMRWSSGRGRTSASRRSATADVAASPERLRPPLPRSMRVTRCAPTASATCRSATCRSEIRFSTVKKPLSAASIRSCGYTRPARSRSSSSSGVRSTTTTSSARARTESGTVSRTRTPVSSVTRSLSDSRCWTFIVEITSIPASSTISTSW